MRYTRMPIEAESPEQMGYDKIRNNLSESSYTDAFLNDFAEGADLGRLLLCYGSHEGHEGLRELIVKGSGTQPLAANSPETIRPNTGQSPTTLTPDQVLLTIGAAGALFIIATTLLEKGDELIVVSTQLRHQYRNPTHHRRRHHLYRSSIRE